MAKIGKETGKSQYKNGKSMFGEFFISQTNSKATPSPLIKAKMASIFFINRVFINNKNEGEEEDEFLFA